MLSRQPLLSFIQYLNPSLYPSVVEATIGVICSSIPQLPAYFRRHPAITHILQKIRSAYRSRFQKREEVKQPLEVVRGNLGPEEKFTTTMKKKKAPVETEVLGRRSPPAHQQQSPSMSTNPPNNNDNYDHNDSSPSSTTTTTTTTRREHYEMAVPSSQQATTTTRSTSSRRGYWDLLSMFRSSNRDRDRDDTSLSGVYLRS